MTLSTDFATVMRQKDLSDPVEKMCFDIMIESLFGELLAEKPEAFQKGILDALSKTGPNKA
tara:strand:- start:578 stop:760 length:183 start_codon:yes stop_codon:yes gene_type:complete